MKLRQTLVIAAATAGLLLTAALPANAFISMFVMADRVIKKENKKALATPGHAAWCAKQAPGFRKQWNNWRTPNGRVKYCASPYFTPLWMRGRK
jgi:hypothetical protein